MIIILLWSRFFTRKIKEEKARYVGSIHESMHIALMQSIQECFYGNGADASADPFFFSNFLLLCVVFIDFTYTLVPRFTMVYLTCSVSAYHV